MLVRASEDSRIERSSQITSDLDVRALFGASHGSRPRRCVRVRFGKSSGIDAVLSALERILLVRPFCWSDTLARRPPSAPLHQLHRRGFGSFAEPHQFNFRQRSDHMHLRATGMRRVIDSFGLAATLVFASGRRAMATSTPRVNELALRVSTPQACHPFW